MKRLLFALSIAFCLNTNAQIITTVAGGDTSGYSGDGGLATNAKLYAPYGIATDTIGNIYIADAGNSCIRKINTVGIISTIAGTGIAGYTGDGGLATAAELYRPYGIAVDKWGNVYFSDAATHCIRKVNTAGIIKTIAGTGTSGYSGDGGPATLAKLYLPWGISVDTSDNVYVADCNNYRIRKIFKNGIIVTIAGNGSIGHTVDGTQATNAALYATNGVAVDAANNIYFTNENTIRKIQSGILSTVAGNYSSGYSGDGGSATMAELNVPLTVCLDKYDNIYIADYLNYCIRKVNTAGIIITIAGKDTSGYSGDGGAATSAKMGSCEGIATDAFCNLYIGDISNNRVRMVSMSDGCITSIFQYSNLNSQISVYPNPSNGVFNLSISPFDNDKTNNIEIYNLIGECVHRQNITSAISKIDVNSLPNGIYNISLTSSKGIENKRIVIVK